MRIRILPMPRWFDEVRHDPYSCYRSMLIVFGHRTASRHRELTNRIINGNWKRRFVLLIGHLLWCLRRVVSEH